MVMKDVVDLEMVTQKGHWRYLEELKSKSRINRKNLTRAEAKIWYGFLRKKPEEVKFTRQKPINRFILDFYCSKFLLAIEIDGDSHINKRENDVLRDEYLNCLSIKTLRFKNEEIMDNFELVKEKIVKIIRQRKSSLLREVPPSLRGAEGLEKIRVCESKNKV